MKVIAPNDINPEDIREEHVIGYAYARTLCRDSATARQLASMVEGPADYPVKHNTAFAHLFNDPDHRWYLSNNLPKDMKNGNYQNTSITKYDKHSNKSNTWSLPYRASFVWPIRQVRSQSVRSSGVFTGQQELIGFLAIDSPITGVFDLDLHFDIGALLADTLYIFLNHAIPHDDEPSAGDNAVVGAADPC